MENNYLSVTDSKTGKKFDVPKDMVLPDNLTITHRIKQQTGIALSLLVQNALPTRIRAAG